MVCNGVAIEQFPCIVVEDACIVYLYTCIVEEDAGAPESSWEQQHIPFTH